jgi:hypothetical protein
VNNVSPLRQLGLVVHPVREISRALNDIETWARAHNITVVQLQVPLNMVRCRPHPRPPKTAIRAGHGIT